MTPPMRPPTPPSEPPGADGPDDATAARPGDAEPVTAPPVGDYRPDPPPGWGSGSAQSWASVPSPAPHGGDRPRHEPQAGLPRRVVYAVLAVVALMLIAAVTATVVTRLRDRPGGGQANTATAPLGGVRDAEFQLVSGVTSVTVRTQDLGGDLYRISTPPNSGAVPNVVNDNGRVQLDVTRAHGNAGTSVEVRLHSSVRWQLGLIGGSSAATVDARNANLAGVDFTGGVTRIEVWLPRPQGRVVARMAGGAGEVVVHAPDNVLSRVRIGSGAASVTIDGERHSGVAPNTVYAPTGWDQAADRYDIDATAGVGTLIVDRY